MITIDKDKVGIISDMASNANSGQKDITVKDGTLFANGETVVIKDSVSRETNTVASVAGNVVTMQNNLANTYTTANSGFVKNTADSVDLVDFPMLVSLDSDASLASNAKSDGYDIAFTASNESTQLKHEIESYNNSTGALIAWVKIPTLSTSADTVIYMYYGNASATDQSDKNNVWNNNYVTVQHLNDLTTSTVDDSTSGNYDGAKSSANNPLESDAKIYKAQDFSSDSINYGALSISNTYTAEAWIKADTLSASGDRTTFGSSVFASALLGSGYGTWLTIGKGGGTEVTLVSYETANTGHNTTGAGLNTTDWFHIVAIATKSGNAKVYVNGVERLSFTTSNTAWSGNFTLGDLRDARGIYFDGLIDEVRLSNNIRDFDWISTEYKNQNSPSTFYTLGNVETRPVDWWNDSWNYKKMITIDHDKVGIISDLGETATSGQKDVTVKDGTLFTSGETVVIKDSVSRETNTVASVAGNVVTMQNNLANTYTTANSGFVKNTADSVDLVDFPMLVSLDSDASLLANARSDGYDIAFTDNATTPNQLKHEIESYTSATGALVSWVKIPTLSTSADTVIYMYYGNASATDQSDKTNVWDSHYIMVQHLTDFTTATTSDSTINAKNGSKTAHNNPAEINGQISKAQSFDGSDRIGTTINGAWGDFTVELWFKDTSDTRAYERLADKGYAGCFWLGRNISGANSWGGGVKQASPPYGVFITLSDNSWHQIATIRSGTNHYIWGDGGSAHATDTVSNTLCTNGNFAIGGYGDGSTPGQWLSNGLIDEVRVSDIARGRDWFKTEYNNIYSPSTFYTLGNVEIKPVVGGDLTASSTIFMGGSTSTTLLPPVIYYNFDEGYGTTTHNIVSTTNNGIANGTSWTNDGKFGKALSFSGSSNYVFINDNPQSYSSFSAWIKTSSASEQVIASGMFDNSDILIEGGKITKSSVSGLESLKTVNTFNDNSWHHIVVIKTGLAYPDNFIFYVDGKIQQTQTSTSARLAGKQLIGARYSASSYSLFFNGLIDEVKIYDYALSSDQVRLDYNDGKAMVLGSSGTSSSTQSSGAQYCVPGDTSFCASPIAEYKFDEKIGTVANDTSGNNKTGIITGALWSRGKIGSALTFDNVDDGVNIANENFTSLTDYTMSAWINIKGTHKNYTGVIISSGNWNGNHWAFGISQNNAQVQFKKPDGTTWYAKAYSFSLNRWYKVDAVRSGINLYYYVNGQFIGTSTIGSGNIVSDASNTTIGRETYSSGYFDFNGSIDDVKIYNYARTPAQVAWDYNKGAPIAHYKFDECSGTVAHDKSGNGYDGTISIGATGAQSAVGTCTDSDTAHAWYNGRTGKYKASLNFDGTDDYVYGASNLGISGDVEFTMCAWVYWAGDNWSSNYPSFMGNNSTGVTNQGLSFTVNSGRPAIDFWVNRFRATNALSVKTWYHICGTKTPGIIGSTSKIYVDSKLVSGAVEGTNTTPNITNSVSIIGRLDATRWFNGKIDDAKFFNYALTSEQIKLEYAGSALKFN